MEKKKPTEWKDLDKGAKVTAFVVLGIMVLIVVGIISAFSGSDELDGLTWNEMSVEQKAQFSDRKLQSSNATLFQTHVMEQIESKFKYPATVEFENRYQVVTGARLIDASSGLYFNNGGLTAKNAFGVPTKYLWEIEFECNENFKVKRIDVFEM